MDPSYETVVDVQDLVWTLFAYLIHGASVAVQAGLAAYLVGTGVHHLARPDSDGRWLRRFGVPPVGAGRSRRLGGIRIVLGSLLLSPLAFGAPMLVSLSAAVAAGLLIVTVERRVPSDERRPGWLVRRGATGFAVFAAVFMLWEGEDSLALGADLLVHGVQWRNEEFSWQLETDPEAPKVGELAPDFELQDPDGHVAVRLSDFRGKRPVALVFGSYT
jgi:hypothetical protein